MQRGDIFECCIGVRSVGMDDQGRVVAEDIEVGGCAIKRVDFRTGEVRNTEVRDMLSQRLGWTPVMRIVFLATLAID